MKNNDPESCYRKAITWLLSNKCGTSSKTILTSIMNFDLDDWDCDIPYDPSDFSRCFGLLELFPEWRPMLYIVAQKHPKWAPFVENWDMLENLYRNYLDAPDQEKSCAAKTLYDKLKMFRKNNGESVHERLSSLRIGH